MSIKLSENDYQKIVNVLTINAKWINDYRKVFKCSLKHFPGEPCRVCKEIDYIRSVIKDLENSIN